ncbi:MAG: cation:proton antiporter [Acuticoccus sp.]
MEHEAAAHGVPYLKETLIFLIAAGIAVPVLQRFGLNTILGYLLCGVLVGPFGLVSVTQDLFGVGIDMLTIPDQEGVHKIAELGVVFLLFLIGLELSGPRLWAMRRLVFGLGLAQVVITSAVLAGLASLTGLSPEASVAIGASLALSSTAIVVQLLVERGRLASPAGQVMFAVLLLQDIAVVVVLLLITALAAEEAGSILFNLAFSVVAAGVIIPLILFAGSRVVGPVLRFVGARQDRDMFTAAALLIIVAAAAATSLAGLSMALGAFLAGLVFADSEFAHQLEAEIAPFKGLLLGFFFLSVGMTIDPRVVIEEPVDLLVVIGGVIAAKVLILFLLALLWRQSLAVSLESALMLGQIGEFSLVGLALAASLHVIPSEEARLLVVAAGVTMALTTAFATPIARLARFIERRRSGEAFPNTLAEGSDEGHVIIVGFGRIGRAIGELMEERHIPYLAIDLDPHAVARARKNGMPVHFGDVRRADVLKHAHAARARAIVLTMDKPASNGAALVALKKLGITTPVVVRARDVAHAKELYELGANEVVLEAFEAALQMGEETLVALGFPRDAAHALIGDQRERGKHQLADRAR